MNLSPRPVPPGTAVHQDSHLFRTGYDARDWYIGASAGALVGMLSGLFGPFAGVIGVAVGYGVIRLYREIKAERQERRDFEEFLDSFGDSR